VFFRTTAERLLWSCRIEEIGTITRRGGDGAAAAAAAAAATLQEG